jgi:hypothetical protein
VALADDNALVQFPPKRTAAGGDDTRIFAMQARIVLRNDRLLGWFLLQCSYQFAISGIASLIVQFSGFAIGYVRSLRFLS